MGQSEQIILLARQRSGTHALKSVLASHPAFHCFEEIFHAEPEFRKCPENFFRFIEEQDLPASALFPWKMIETLESFLGALNQLTTDAQFQVLDVKYNSTHLVWRSWQSMYHYSAFFDYLKEKQLRVLHLRRENLLRQWLSRELAAQVDTWFVEKGAPEAMPPLVVNPDQLLCGLKGLQEEDNLICCALRECRVLELEYSDLFLDPSGRVPERQLQRINAWLDSDYDFSAQPAYVKQAQGSLPELIDNFDEAAAALKGTEFAWMLRDEIPKNG